VLAEIQEASGRVAELIPGGNGIFDVTKDGVVVFSKHKIGRFPLEGEISDLLAEA